VGVRHRDGATAMRDTPYRSDDDGHGQIRVVVTGGAPDHCLKVDRGIFNVVRMHKHDK
jgi:hypothetical protein